MRDRASGSVVGLLALALGAWSAPVAQEQSNQPLEMGIEERLEVRFVLVDLLVLDRRERTVPGLGPQDFLLLVDGDEVPVASLDHDCPVGAAPDPLPGRARPAPAEPPPVEAPSAQPRRIVLVFDYLHMPNPAETFDQVERVLDTMMTGNEEHMVVSLGQVVRIESPFTRDRDEVRWTIDRMRNDPDLYAGVLGRLSEAAFYERIRILFDLLEPLPGRKTIVLFSGPFRPDPFDYDLRYRELSALSAASRTAVYAVDTAGLTVGGRMGGPPELRRLANETGGRMVSDTNATGLIYAKAHRDLGCTYTLGFYDPAPRLDRDRRLTIRVKDRSGHRVVYPDYYVIRSPEEKRESLVHTASMTPHMFESPELDAELFVLGPRSPRRWRALLGVEIRLGSDAWVEPGEQWKLRGFLRKPNGTVVHSFERRIEMPATDARTRHNPVVTVFHELSLAPGRYVASAILADPEGETPRAATRPAEIAGVPLRAPFLIGPILGSRRQPPTTGSDDAEPSFRPLLVRETEQGEPLESLTLLCTAEPDSNTDLRTLAREISTLDGERVRRFEPVTIPLSGDRRVHCHEQIDPVATSSLEPGRYEITALAGTLSYVTDRGSAEFAIRPPSTGRPEAEP